MDNNNVPQILLLEDEADRAQEFQEVIAKLYPGPIHFWVAQNVTEAQQLLNEQGDILDVVVTDIVMADGEPGGLSFAAEVGSRLPIIVLSAFDPEKFSETIIGLGPVQYIEKGSADFNHRLVDLIAKAIEWKQLEASVDPATSELRSLCLAREPSGIMVVRFHLSPLTVEHVGDLHKTIGDFHPIAVGFRYVERAAEQQGTVYSFADQECRVLYLDSDLTSEPVEENSSLTLEAAVSACKETLKSMNESSPVLSAHPFSAGFVPGTIVTGMFGRRRPGRATVIGRPGDVGAHIASAAAAGEFGVLRSCLSDAAAAWWDALPDNPRVETVRIPGIDNTAEVEYRNLRRLI